MLWIKAALPLDERGVRAYRTAWRALLEKTRQASPQEVQRSLFDHLYDNLNVLDAKTGVVISLNSILIAAYVFILTPSNSVPAADLPAFMLAVSYSTVAVFRSLLVIWLHWSSRANLQNPTAHMRALIRLRTKRTIQFRRAWTYTAVSLVALVILIANEFMLQNRLDLTWPAVTILLAHHFMIYPYDNLVLLAHKRWPAIPLEGIQLPARCRSRWRKIRRALCRRGQRA